MDPLFITLAATGIVGYAWLPVRERICAARKHPIGRTRLRATYEDGTYETEALCMCRSVALIVSQRAFPERKDSRWVAPASVTTPATSP